MSDLKTELELAQRLFGSQPSGGLGVRRISATATADSADGTVELDVGGETVEVPVVGHVSSGDEVSVLVENGAAYAIGTDGWGDAIQDAASTASAIATATGQHFWTDTAGVHVTTAEGDATTGPNVILNSQGQLFRADTDEVLAIERMASPSYGQGGVIVFNPDYASTCYIEGASGGISPHLLMAGTDMPVDIMSEPSSSTSLGWGRAHARLQQPDADSTGSVFYVEDTYAGASYKVLDVGEMGKTTTNGFVAKPHPVFDQTLNTSAVEVDDAFGSALFKVKFDGTIESSVYGVSTASGWTVEKRPGGIIEATRTITGSLAVTSSYAGRYISALQSTSLPSGLFSTIDWAGVEVSYSPGLWDAHLTSVTTSAIGYYIACNASTTANITRRVYVRGR